MYNNRLQLTTLQATKELAACLALHIQCGDIIALTGDLGAGKTTLTAMILGEWGVEGVTSPTFNLLHSYTTKSFIVHHLDLYRLEHIEEVYRLGWDELCDDSSVVIVEWMGKFADLFPKDFLQLTMYYTATGREVEVSSLGYRSLKLHEELIRCASTGN